MPITIGSNIASLQAQRRLNEGSAILSRVYERLASGQRINRASDDAAGLAIASSLRADAKVLGQAVRNLNDGLSLLNIAEGSLLQLSSIVTRQKELAEQAANGVYGAAQRVAIEREADALTAEWSRIVAATEFNGRSVLNGEMRDLSLQAGYGENGRLSVGIGRAIAVTTGDGTFSGQSTFAVNNNVADVVTGDFNGDGKADIISIDRSANAATLLLGNGDGSFKAGTSFSTGGAAFRAATADLNGDGALDLVIGTPGLGAVAVQLGNGNGTFKARSTYSVGNTGGVVLADFNNDSILDIATNHYSGTAGTNGAIFLGNGNGSFQARLDVSTGAFIVEANVGDFNGDGNADLIYSGELEGLFVHLGNGNGTFGATVSLSDDTYTAVAADVNNDGRTDVVSFGNNTIKVHLGNGNGTFKNAVGILTQGFSTLLVEDLNGDGNEDIVTTGPTGSSAFTLLGNGNGSFKAAQGYGTDPGGSRGIALGDFNGDGVHDITFGRYSSTRVLVLLGGATTNVVEPDISLSNAQTAREALESLSQISKTVQRELSVIGAHQSRLLSASAQIYAMRENFEAAQARISDVDIAHEAAALTRTSILQQVGAAVLAQANQQPKLALDLLRV